MATTNEIFVHVDGPFSYKDCEDYLKDLLETYPEATFQALPYNNGKMIVIVSKH